MQPSQRVVTATARPDQFTGLGIEVLGLGAGAAERGVAAHGIGRELADLADATLEFVAVDIPVEHEGSSRDVAVHAA